MRDDDVHLKLSTAAASLEVDDVVRISEEEMRHRSI